MQRIDISMPLYEGMPSFPGDPAFRSTRVRSTDRGDPYNLSELHLGSHTGTHVDPPVHFVRGGTTVDELDLGVLNGPARVVDVDPRSSFVGAVDAEKVPPGASRVLFRTANSARWAKSLAFFSDYVALRSDAASVLVQRGVRFVGIDALSIENDPSGQFPVHHLLLGHGTLILEGLLLEDAPAGEYSLECLPLRVRGGDGGPARAALLSV